MCKTCILLVPTVYLFLGGCRASHKIDKTQAPAGSIPLENSIIWADSSNLLVSSHGSDYYLISNTMHLKSGAPIMKSKVLVPWENGNYIFDSLTYNSKYNFIDGMVYDRGQWASSIRYYKDKYYVLFSPCDVAYHGYTYSTTDPEKEI